MLLPPSVHLENMTALPGTRPAVDPTTHHLITEAYRHAIATTFFTGAVLAALAFLIVLALPEMPLRLSNPARPDI